MFAAVIPVANVGALLREGDHPKRVQSLPATPPDVLDAEPVQAPSPSATATAATTAMRFLLRKAETLRTEKRLLA
jgi:hypothetical protein